MSDIVERLRGYAADDHERGCAGRYYDCSCGYDAKRDPLMDEAADEITRLKVKNIQMQAALGYAICADDERHIIPENPFKCGICDANKGIHAEVERLRAVLDLYRQAVRIDATMEGPRFMGSNASALKRAWDADLAALGGGDEP